jgi:RNA polymerase primary sigma factor/RNA polymerase nonessential primary-like sigma factor
MSSTETTPEFRDQNSELFRRRRELRAELASAEADEATSGRRLRMLRRSLDDVTTNIVSYNMGLVRSYTRRFGGAASADHRAEFEAAGVLGLMRAIDSYDADSGSFGQWAFKPIQREVLRSVRDVDHQNLNMGDFEKRPAILRAYRQLAGVDQSYQPSYEEVAEAAEVTVGQVRRVLGAPQLTSVHQRVGDDHDTELGDTIESDDVDTDVQVITKQILAGIEQFGFRALDQRELFVIVRRFGLDGEPAEKLSDLGDTLGLSREAVRQIEAKALAKLQHPIMVRRLLAVTTSPATAGV